jgi:hypothetical protein
MEGGHVVHEVWSVLAVPGDRTWKSASGISPDGKKKM